MEEPEGGFFPDPTAKEAKKEEDQSITIPLRKSECCMHCERVPVVAEIRKVFSICVCSSCSHTHLKFITKTQCKSDYLLTEEELREFKHLSRPNPHKGTWNDMQLYLESEISEFSLAKHGSMEQVELIKESRMARSKKRKMDKIKHRVRELKKRTLFAAGKERHTHSFARKGKFSECSCGMKIEQEEI